MTDMQGYLVVVKDVGGPSNPRYRGIDRKPVHPSRDPLIAQVLDDYVLGDYLGDWGLIPQESRARELLARLSISSEEFECLYAREHSGAPSSRLPKGATFLGLDIASTDGPLWSPVGRFPLDEATRPHFQRLNRYGLFSSSEDAEAYLRMYQEQERVFYDVPLAIWEVYVLDGLEQSDE